MKINILDTETTSLHGTDGKIVEISIVEVDLDSTPKKITKKYDTVVGYDISKWRHREKKAWIFKNSSLKLEDVDINNNANEVAPVEQVVKEVRQILKDKIATSYNIDFDFHNYLFNTPWNINNDHLRKGSTRYRLFNKGDLSEDEYLDFMLAPCIMIAATDVCQIPHFYGYKWPTLDEAMSILPSNGKIKLDPELENLTDRHRALYDTVESAKVLIGLYEMGKYDIDKIDNINSKYSPLQQK